MNFDEIVVKESPGLCRCCLSEGCYKDLGAEYTWMNDTEVYAEMLLDCFDIGITQHNDGPNGAKRLICEVCITRLRDACNFKKQVLDSEKRFIDMLGRGEFRPKVIIYEPQNEDMKVESEEAADDPDLAEDIEYLEELEYTGDEDVKREEGQSTSQPTTSVEPDIPRPKRGRPKKEEYKLLKPTKVKKAKVAKGVIPNKKATAEAVSKSSLSANMKNRLMKQNAATVLECSTVVPFKWQRQNYLCFYCHRALKTMDEVKEHTHKLHSQPNTKAAFSLLRQDQKVKVDVSSIQCKLCHDQIKDLNVLIEHIRTVHKRVFNDGDYGLMPYKLESDAYQCAICDETFPYFMSLNRHMNEHYGLYVCEVCGKSFLSGDRLRCHSLCHRSNFHCDICLKSFDSLSQKNNHDSKIHNNPKLLKCCYCPETFINYTLRKRHHNKAHNVEMPEYKCPVCGKSFNVHSRMTVHLREVHIKEKNFSCNVCGLKFFSKTRVQKHMVRHMSEKCYQCELCKKTYARRQTLKDHMRTHKTDD